MTLTDTQQQIEQAIRGICRSEPVATVNDITEIVPVSRQTVLNNLEAVLSERSDIRTRRVGQADVYFVRDYGLDDIQNENGVTVCRLETRSEAAFGELREAAEDSEFDYTAHWYDYTATEIPDYEPTPEEVGILSQGYWTMPVAIRYTTSEPWNDER